MNNVLRKNDMPLTEYETNKLKVSISITMTFVLAFISWASPYDAFGGINFLMHVVCPLLILISFYQIENRYIFTLKDCFIGSIPFCIYAIVYIIEVVVIGDLNGGWPDIYQVQNYLSVTFAIPMLIVFGFIISCIVALLSNHFTKIRDKKSLNIGRWMLLLKKLKMKHID